MFKTNISFEKFYADSNNFEVKLNMKSFIDSYPIFLKYFNDLDNISKENIIVGINFTYGWMPTIFKFGQEEIEKSISILNAVKEGNTISIENLQILKRIFHNSLVGTSKLLHFISPKNYAIWDSRVYRYLMGQEPYNYRVENIDLYLDYLHFCNEISSEKKYPSVHNAIETKVGYSLTNMRAIELVMYHMGGTNI
jgi:hypothetical protein